MALQESLLLATKLTNQSTGKDIFPEALNQFTKIEKLESDIVIDSSLSHHDYDLGQLADVDLLFMKCVYYETDTLSGAVEGEPAPFVPKLSGTDPQFHTKEIPCKGLLILPLSQPLTAISVSTPSTVKVKISL